MIFRVHLICTVINAIMRNVRLTYLLIFVLPIALLVTACPVNTSYPLGKKGDVKTDDRLIGTWFTTAEDVEANKIRISKGPEANTYTVSVVEQGSMFMAESTEFTGWLTQLNGKTFLVLQEMESGKPTESYYVYHIAIDAKKIVSSDITLKVGGTDAITSIDAYRQEVAASMKLDGFLAGDIVWTK